MKGVSLAQASRQCDVSINYFMKLVNGNHRNPTYATILRICNALGCDPNFLFEWSTDIDADRKRDKGDEGNGPDHH